MRLFVLARPPNPTLERTFIPAPIHPGCRITPAHPRRLKQRGGPKCTGQSSVLQPAGRTARRTLENQQHRASGLNLLVAQSLFGTRFLPGAGLFKPCATAGRYADIAGFFDAGNPDGQSASC